MTQSWNLEIAIQFFEDRDEFLRGLFVWKAVIGS
jgi:hypothetical protein